MVEHTLFVADGAGMRALGARIARYCPRGVVIFIGGELGTGKTTLVRGFLAACGVGGPVRSPTYTLIEPYELARGHGFHLDLYRLGDPEELELLGIRDLLDGSSVILVEWPERGAGMLPAPDLQVRIAYEGEGRSVTLIGSGPEGERLLARVLGEPSALGTANT
jgi:tRNA threonylcarbamoyladenosine biosynthesis protein TsaE